MGWSRAWIWMGSFVLKIGVEGIGCRNTNLAFQLDLFLILIDSELSLRGEQDLGYIHYTERTISPDGSYLCGRLSVVCSMRFACRVKPDSLPVLDQDEGEHHHYAFQPPILGCGCCWSHIPQYSSRFDLTVVRLISWRQA